MESTISLHLRKWQELRCFYIAQLLDHMISVNLTRNCYITRLIDRLIIVISSVTIIKRQSAVRTRSTLSNMDE